MYGNFDGIKDRARLRKEVKDLRLNRLEKLKKSKAIFNKKGHYFKAPKARLIEVKKIIQEKAKKEKRQHLLYQLILIAIVGSLLLFFIWAYIYPFLF